MNWSPTTESTKFNVATSVLWLPIVIVEAKSPILSVPINVLSLTALNVPDVSEVLISAVVPSPLTSMSRSNLTSSVNLASPLTTNALSNSASVTLTPTLPSLSPRPVSVISAVSVETRNVA